MDEIRLEPSRAALPEVPSLSEGRAGAGAGPGFGSLLAEAVGSANQEIVRAEHEARELAEGRGGIVEAVLSLSKADLSLRFVVELRNRFVEAYREITRIQA